MFVLCVCWQDGKAIVSGSHDKTVRLWDVVSGRELQKLEGHSFVTSVAFSPVRGGWHGGYALRGGACGVFTLVSRVWSLTMVAVGDGCGLVVVLLECWCPRGGCGWGCACIGLAWQWVVLRMVLVLVVMVVVVVYRRCM